MIGGWLEGKYTGMRYVHANGSVEAKVWYSQKETVPLKEIKTERTGKEETRYCVKINNFPINLYKTLSNFKKYDTIKENKKIKLFSDFYLPLTVEKITNYEIKEEEVTYTKEQAKEIAVDKAKQALDEKITNKENIVNIYTNYQETDNAVEVEVIYEVLEEIGTKEKIVF